MSFAACSARDDAGRAKHGIAHRSSHACTRRRRAAYGLACHNIQVAVDAKHHLIVAHEIINVIYIQRDDVYQCPAGERLRWRQTTFEKGLNIHS